MTRLLDCPRLNTPIFRCQISRVSEKEDKKGEIDNVSVGPFKEELNMLVGERKNYPITNAEEIEREDEKQNDQTFFLMQKQDSILLLASSDIKKTNRKRARETCLS